MTRFAELLRRHRVDAGLSQEGLAEKSGLSTDAIGLLERGARRHPHRYTLQALADGLGLAGPERDRFLAVGRSRSPAAEALTPAIDRFSNQLNPIIGRESEIEEASSLLQSGVALLTLTGPGGVGKTRLALVLADRLAGAFQDGVMFVSLAAIRDLRSCCRRSGRRWACRPAPKPTFRMLSWRQLPDVRCSWSSTISSK